MKKYFGIILIGLSAGFISCADDDDSDENGPTGGGPAFETTVRIEENGETTNYPAYATFTEEYVDAFELYVFSIDAVESLDLPNAKFLIGMSIYSETPILETLAADTNFTFQDSWVAGGPEDDLGLGVTWRDESGNSTLYSEVVDGGIFISDLNTNRIRGLFSFKIVSPATGDTLTARTSELIARPQE